MTFSTGLSTLSGSHDGDPAGAVDYASAMALPAGAAALIAPFSGAGHSIVGGGWSSLARGGAGHVEAVNSARITFPAGMGVDQTDAGHVVAASTYTMNFDFKWTAVGAVTPIGGAFSIPIGASVPVGGSASFVAPRTLR